MDDFIDMNEEDALAEINLEASHLEATQLEEQQSETHSGESAQVPRKRRKTSRVWEDFESVGVEVDGRERARCLHCCMKFVTRNEKNVSCGTHHLQRHLDTCPKKPSKEDKVAYDQKIDREKVSEIIIYHDLPFRYIEYEKVRARDKYLNPDCQPICRQTAAADVYKKYEVEKEKLKKVFARHTGRICFTSDLWTSRPNSMGYICLTAHFIDDGWNLQSKILAFCDLMPPHTGEVIANKILECMMEWGIEKKVFSLTLDNANNNDCMQRILKGQLQMMSGYGLLSDGKYLHVRCSAHILNLIVKEGLELAKDLLLNIRESVRYVKGSQTRIQAFAACVERVGIRDSSGLSLDVTTRWNSTYGMLVRALKLREAFQSLATFDRHYRWLPSEREWDRGQKISELLKPFSQITNLFSGSKYPTSNVYFMEVWRIELLLRHFASCDDFDLKEMAKEMQVKFAKYWEDYSIILAMAAVFDPRLKLDILEKAYERVDPSTSTLKTVELKTNLTELYKEYQAGTWGNSSGSSFTPTPQDLVNESPLEDDLDNDLFELERSLGSNVGNTRTHLDVYLDEKRLDRKSFRKLDVLNYWRENQARFGDLAMMARDILSIPITTVASESAFSIGARVLTPYRSRLLPKNVQALLCTRNWLRGFAEYEGTIEDVDDMCNEDARKTTSTSGGEGSRSEDSNVR